MNALPIFSGGNTGSETMKYQEIEESPNSEHYKGISVDTVFKFNPGRCVFVLFQGKSPDTSIPYFIQVPGSGMMNRMFMPPFIIRSKCEYTRNCTPNVIGYGGFEKGTVSAVMENDKNSYHKTGRRHSYQ
jgi:hypothetical protein